MLSMAQLRSETLAHLGIDPTDLDPTGSANLDLLINRSWWALLDQFDFKEKEKVATFPTVSGTKDYLLQTIIGSDIFEAITLVSVISPSSLDHDPLEQISTAFYEEQINDNPGNNGQPINYYHYGPNIRLFPTPDTVYTIILNYQYILTDLTAGNPAIPQGWHESILYGAVQRGFLRARDFNSAEMFRLQQGIALGSTATTLAKEDKHNKMSGVQVYRNEYSVKATGTP